VSLCRFTRCTLNSCVQIKKVLWPVMNADNGNIIVFIDDFGVILLGLFSTSLEAGVYHGLIGSQLTKLFVADSGHCLLQSAANRTCCPTCTHLWRQEFTSAGLWVWNSLPSQLRQDISYGQFRRQLKTFLFRINWPRRIVTVCLFAP